MGVHNEQDKVYKKAFYNPLLVQHLLEGFLPEKLAENLDFSTLENRCGYYITPNLEDRLQDIVWSVRFKDEPNTNELQAFAGEEIYLYFLLEFQSEPSARMAVRMLSYVAALYDQLLKTEKIKLHKQKLPITFPFVLYTGKRKWNYATDLAGLLPEVPEFLADYQFGQKFFLLNSRELDEVLPASETNLIKRYFSLENSELSSEFFTQLQLLIEQIKRLDTTNNLTESIELLLSYHLRKVRKADKLAKQLNLYELVQKSDEDYQSEVEKMAYTFPEWREQLLQEGWLAGKQEGWEKGQLVGEQEGWEKGVESTLKSAVLNMKTHLNLTAERIAEVLQQPLEKINKLLEK